MDPSKLCPESSERAMPTPKSILSPLYLAVVEVFGVEVFDVEVVDVEVVDVMVVDVEDVDVGNCCTWSTQRALEIMVKYFSRMS